MGAWGTGVFDNDTACDWAYTLEESKDLTLVEETLDKVLAQGTEYIEASDAEEALAAIEVIARLHGNWGVRNSYTEAVDNWVGRMSRFKPAQPLIDKANRTIDRILREPSEILEIWSDSELLEQWRSGVLELKTRVIPGQHQATVGISASSKPWWQFW